MATATDSDAHAPTPTSEATVPASSASTAAVIPSMPMHTGVPPPPANTAHGTLSSRPARAQLHCATPPPPLLSASAALAFAQSQSHLPAASALRGHMHAQSYATSAPGESRPAMLSLEEWDALVEQAATAQRMNMQRQQLPGRSAHVHHSSSMRPLARGGATNTTSSKRRNGSSTAKLGARSRSAAAGAFASSREGADSDDASASASLSASASVSRSRSRLGAPSPLHLQTSLLPAPYFAGQGFSHFPLAPAGTFFYPPPLLQLQQPSSMQQQSQSQAMQLAPGSFLPSPMPFPTPMPTAASPLPASSSHPSPSTSGSPLQQQGQTQRSYALHFETATPAAPSAAAASPVMQPSAPATPAPASARTSKSKRQLVTSSTAAPAAAARPATALERVHFPRNADGHARLPPDPSYSAAGAAAAVPIASASVYGPSYASDGGDVTATPTVSDLRALAHRAPGSATPHAASSPSANFHPSPLPPNLSRSQLMQPALMEWFYSGTLREPTDSAGTNHASTTAAGVAPMLTAEEFAALVYSQQMNLLGNHQQQQPQPDSRTLTLDLPEQDPHDAALLLTTPHRRGGGADDGGDSELDLDGNDQDPDDEQAEEGHDVVAALDSERAPSPLPMSASPPTPLPSRGRSMSFADHSGSGNAGAPVAGDSPTPGTSTSRPRTSHSARARSAASSRASWRQTGRRSRGGPSSSSGSRPSSAQMLAPPPSKMHAAIQSMLLAHAAGRSQALALINDGTSAASSAAAERARLDFLLSTPAQRELEAAEQGFLRLERRRAEDAREWREWLRLKRAAVRLHRSQQRFQSAQARAKERGAGSTSASGAALERPSSSFAHNSTLAATKALASAALDSGPLAPAALVAEAEAEMDAYSLARQERELIARCDAELAAATARITADAGLYAQAIMQPLSAPDSHAGQAATRSGLPPTHGGHGGHGHVARAMSVSLGSSQHHPQQQLLHAAAMRQRSTGSVSLGHAHGPLLAHPHAHSVSAGNGAAFSGLGNHAAGNVMVPAGGFPDFAPPVHLQPQQYNYAYAADAALLPPSTGARRPASAARVVGEEKEAARSRSRSRPGTARAGSRSRGGSRPATASGARGAGSGASPSSRPDSASAFGSRAAAFEFQAHRIVPWHTPNLTGGAEITGPLSVATAAAVAALAAEKQQAAAAAASAAAAAARNKHGPKSPSGPNSPAAAATAPASSTAVSVDSPPQPRLSGTHAHTNGGRPLPRAFTQALNEFERGLERQAAARALSAGAGTISGEKPPVPTAASLARERASLSSTTSPLASGRALSKAQAYGHGLHRLSASATTSPAHGASRRVPRSPGARSSLTRSLVISLPAAAAPNGPASAAADGSTPPQSTPEVESEGAALDSLGIPAWKLAQMKSAASSAKAGPRVFHSDRRALARSARDPTKVLHHTAGPKLSAAGGVGKEIASSWHGGTNGAEVVPGSPSASPSSSSPFVSASLSVAEPAALAITLSAANQDSSHAASVSSISPDRASKTTAAANIVIAAPPKEAVGVASLSPQPPASSRSTHARRPSAMFSGPPVAAFPMPTLSAAGGGALSPNSKRRAAAGHGEQDQKESGASGSTVHKSRTHGGAAPAAASKNASSRRSLTNNQHSLFRAPACHDDIAE